MWKHAGDSQLVCTKNCDENAVVRKIAYNFLEADHCSCRISIWSLLISLISLQQKTEIIEAIPQNMQSQSEDKIYGHSDWKQTQGTESKLV